MYLGHQTLAYCGVCIKVKTLRVKEDWSELVRVIIGTWNASDHFNFSWMCESWKSCWFACWLCLCGNRLLSERRWEPCQMSPKTQGHSDSGCKTKLSLPPPITITVFTLSRCSLSTKFPSRLFFYVAHSKTRYILFFYSYFHYDNYEN